MFLRGVWGRIVWKEEDCFYWYPLEPITISRLSFGARCEHILYFFFWLAEQSVCLEKASSCTEEAAWATGFSRWNFLPDTHPCSVILLKRFLCIKGQHFHSSFSNLLCKVEKWGSRYDKLCCLPPPCCKDVDFKPKNPSTDKIFPEQGLVVHFLTYAWICWEHFSQDHSFLFAVPGLFPGKERSHQKEQTKPSPSSGAAVASALRARCKHL